MTEFKSLRIFVEKGVVTRRVELCRLEDLPDHDVLIKVHFSSLNYKDALSANGHTGISRHYPHTPGIDAAGVVVSDQSHTFKDGEQVAVIGFDLGMNTWGGLSEYIRVPKEWVISLPAGISLADAMRLGTAGVTAGYCLEKLLRNGLAGSQANVLVTGATGGVGSITVHLLASLGYKVTASSGKTDQYEWLTALGASQIIGRQDLSAESVKALLPETYDAAVDTVGQDTLVNILKSLKYGGSVAACGIVGGTAVPLDIYPFILRHVNLLGVASATASLADRQRVLAKYASHWRLRLLESLCEEISLEQVSERVDAMLAGTITRRALVKLC
ncbi:YhdH/YhfP family quinone oxidoreductase [Reinekea sp.]|jgi:acrylyl-CoA reductase (NADPH)|uniref:YhdH/YhfP family quinone oxidoreductase n=1 Tax=Reinekea sp. TaxID=1970455 RepID=UPI00398A43A0